MIYRLQNTVFLAYLGRLIYENKTSCSGEYRSFSKCLRQPTATTAASACACYSTTASTSSGTNHCCGQPVELALKRKLAVGRLTNETNYGRSLLREAVTGQHDQKNLGHVHSSYRQHQ